MFTLLAVLVFTYGISHAQVHDTIVKWTFPTNTATDTVADGGIGINLNQVIHVFGTNPITFTSTGVSTYSASATSWKAGVDTKYWQVMFNTTGYDSLFYSSIQKSSNTGPRDFKVQYRIGKEGTWTDIPVDTIRIPSVTTGWPTNTMLDTLPTACNNKDSVFIRWDMRDTLSVNGTAISSNGSSRIDNIKVWGHNISGVTPPVVTKATLNSLTSATVVFSEAVNATATTVGNYTGLGTVVSAVRTVTNDTVNLTLSGLTNGNAYTLTVANIQDLSNTPMSIPQSYNFLYNGSVDTLVITEINYHNPPYSGNSMADSLEFIELYNNSNVMTRVGGYKLNGGGYGTTALYTFPAGTTIAPNAYLVFAKNTRAVDNFYSITNAIQYANTSLSNTSSRLSIVNTIGGYIDSLTYRSIAPWDTMAKGHGPSLTLCNPGTTIAFNSDPANWTASTFFVDTLAGDSVFGTPGNNCMHNVGITNYKANISSVKCYPNPVRNILTVEPNGFASDITMFDILGNIVFEKKNVSTSIKINTADFNTGIYFVKVTYSNNTVVTQKISVN